ncbi:hypothetical protein VNO78_16496 [Psophocarpus tetragonolobus]|uniref:Uncharacterized protein n=1 Tax=Psophocarpus tetragonolobus TaxID=3891 RepID=A0AAN9SIE8_PSOTE
MAMTLLVNLKVRSQCKGNLLMNTKVPVTFNPNALLSVVVDPKTQSEIKGPNNINAILKEDMLKSKWLPLRNNHVRVGAFYFKNLKRAQLSEEEGIFVDGILKCFIGSKITFGFHFNEMVLTLRA